jgi:hypothetical protein
MYLCLLDNTKLPQIDFVALLLGSTVLLLALAALGEYLAARQTAASNYVAVDVVKTLRTLNLPALWSAVGFGVAYVIEAPAMATLGLLVGAVLFAPRFVMDLNVGFKEYVFWVAAIMGVFASWVPALHSHHTALPLPYGIVAVLVFPLQASIRHCRYVIYTYVFD